MCVEKLLISQKNSFLQECLKRELSEERYNNLIVNPFLKKPEIIGFGLIFLSGIINDIILNFPIGLSSISYLILCVMASLLRNRTLTPNLLYDWTFFFLSILIVNSSNYILQTLIFSSDMSYESLMSNTICTSLVYPIFAKIFNKINIYNLKQ